MRDEEGEIRISLGRAWMWVHPDFNEETSQLHAVFFDPQHGHMHTWWRQEFPMQSEQQEGSRKWRHES